MISPLSYDVKEYEYDLTPAGIQRWTYLNDSTSLSWCEGIWDLCTWPGSKLNKYHNSFNQHGSYIIEKMIH